MDSRWRWFAVSSKRWEAILKVGSSVLRSGEGAQEIRPKVRAAMDHARRARLGAVIGATHL
jgi:hypothetical protein